ncbi:MAG: diguanylate cyclase [Alphaproteobacteria bacterium]|nr:diguanylate cyclase [Alphaproteobacteria bacterium]
MPDNPVLIVTSVKPSRVHVVPAAILASLLFFGAAATLPFSNVALPHNPSFLPAFGAATFSVDLITAILLLGQARIADDAGTLRLGAAYLFSAAIIIPHMAAFPLVMAETPLLGSSATAIWLWAFWHAGFALLIIWHALMRDARRPQVRLPLRIALVVAAVTILAVTASAGLPYLPILLWDNSYERLNSLGVGPFVFLCNVTALALVVGRLRFGTIMALWLSVAMLAACIDVGETLLGLSRFSLGWYVGRFASLLTGLFVLGALLFESLHLYGQLAQVNQALGRLATTDGLTRINNRRAFDMTLDTEWRRAVRDGSEMSLLLADIDWFKGYNDRYGHLAGDDCLRQVAAAVQGALRRASDFAARYGGEEFAVILPGTNAASAMVIAERVRAAVEALDLPHERSTFGHVTISVGVATARPQDGGFAEELIERSDAVLYQAKSRGRNHVISDNDAPAAVSQPVAADQHGPDQALLASAATAANNASTSGLRT